MTRSGELFARAQKNIPGGVNSPVRAFRAVGGDPLFIASASGARLTDVDGKSYIDYVGSWGPMILGHAHPEVLRRSPRRPRWHQLARPRARGSCAEAVRRAVPSNRAHARGRGAPRRR